MSIRTFVALDVNDEVRRRLADATAPMRQHPGAVKWVELDLMHVTLNFLDMVEDGRMDEVRAIVADAAAATAPFEFQVRGVTVVPPKGRARTVWAEVGAADGQMAALQDKLAAGFQRFGVPRESRAFHPHVTLARVKFTPATKALHAHAEVLKETSFGTVRADSVVLLSSELTPDGPVYTPLARVPLGQ